MRAMKDSGIEWIGDIPINWTTSKIKWLLRERKERSVNGEEEPLSMSQKYGLIPTNAMDNVPNPAASLIGTKRCYKNDLVFNKLKAHLGVFAVSQYDGLVSPDYAVYRANDKVNPKYLEYLFKTPLYIGEFKKKSTGVGAGLTRLYTSGLYSIHCVLPPVQEQNKIVSFLNSVCCYIDTVIEQIRISIEGYKTLKQAVITQAVTKGLRPGRLMKYSGIKWVGKIPVDWTVIKGKWILERIERPVIDTDRVITCFRDGQVTLRSNRREEGFTLSLQEVGYQGIDVGDLVVHGMDGFAGAIGISDSRGKGTPVLNILNSNQNKRYLMYYLRSMAFNGVFLALATGIRVRSCDTNWNKIKELLYPLPSIHEQREIADYIDLKVKQIDNLLRKKNEILSTLESFKKSLIYEYVTGKKEVPT